MSHYQRPETQAALEENFAQIKPLMNATMAYYESSRCLFCYDAPCIQACPTEIDIPLFIRQINTGNMTGAARTIYDANYFGHTCGKVCPTEVLCEGACVYNEQDVKPIEIGRLQSFATSAAIEQDKLLFPAIKAIEHYEERISKVAVIGAGPAGIACACELSRLGISVEIFEAKSTPSGLALHGTAPYKITNKEVLDEVAYLQRQFGFLIHYNQFISSRVEFEELEATFDAIFMGIGLGATRPAQIPGEDLAHCVGATEFIEALKSDPFGTYVGKKVVVIGGGNTAMDACAESARMGADVTLLYRRRPEDMSAYHFEYEMVRNAGVRASFNTNVLKLEGNGHVKKVYCIRTEQRNGQVVNLPDTNFEIECDMIIKATGQQKQKEILNMAGISFDSKGRIDADPSSLQCGNTKYFAGGDAVNGGAEVVNACAEGKKAAHSIHEFISRINLSDNEND